MIFKDKHEPIIDRETFEQVQKLTANTKRRAPKPENAPKNMFADFLYCGDCGHKLWFHTNTKNKSIQYFSCSNYKIDTRGTCETRHYVREDALKQVVTLELQQMAQMVVDNEEAFAEALSEKTNADMIKEQKSLQSEIQRAKARCEKVRDLHETLYEKNADGKVTDEWYMELSHKYEVERMELKQKISDCNKRLKQLEEMSKSKDKFLSAVRKFMEMQDLTPAIMRELIDHIDVYETEGTGKSRTQRIVIHYRFVGCIEIPDCPKQHHRASTRKGVEVEYLTA